MGWRTFARTALFALASCAVLYALYAYGLLDFARVGAAFAHRRGLLALDLGCILIMSLIGVARHAWALSVLGVRIPLTRVADANLIGQGVGQWMPGSMVVAEGLRISILFGAKSAARPTSATLLRIGMASLGDRLIGLGVMILTGSVAALLLVLARTPASPPPLYALLSGYLVLGTTLIALPLTGDTPPVRLLARRLEKVDHSRILTRPAAALASALLVMSEASGDWRRNGGFLLTMALSAIAAVLNPLTLVLAAGAIGAHIPWLVLAAAQPATLAGVVLPLGFAGLGAPQLVSVVVFAAFRVSADLVLAMTLLQGALLLAAQTSIALVWAALRGGSIVAALRRSSPA